MERRREPRLKTNTPATIRRLDLNGPPLDATIVDVSGLGVAVKTLSEIPLRAVVRLDWSDGLLLGEVVHSRSDASAVTLGIRVRHSLNDLAGLAANRAAFFECAGL